MSEFARNKLVSTNFGGFQTSNNIKQHQTTKMMIGWWIFLMKKVGQQIDTRWELSKLSAKGWRTWCLWWYHHHRQVTMAPWALHSHGGYPQLAGWVIFHGKIAFESGGFGHHGWEPIVKCSNDLENLGYHFRQPPHGAADFDSSTF